MSQGFKQRNIEGTELWIEHLDGKPSVYITSEDLAGVPGSVARFQAIEITLADSVVTSVNTIQDLINSSNYSVSVLLVDVVKGGLFVYDPTVSTVNDGGIVFNGWVRQYSGVADARWFGAIGDGTTNNKVFVQKAVDAGINELLFYDGTYVLDNITISSPITISCDKASLKLAPNLIWDPNWILNNPMFYVYTNNVSFLRCKVDLNQWNQPSYTQASYGDAVHAHRQLCFVTSMDIDVNDFRMENCEIYNGKMAGVLLAGGKRHYFNNMYMHDLGTGSIFDGVAHYTVENSHRIDGFIVKDSIIENIGVRTSPADTRNFGSRTQPNVTGDGMLWRGSSAVLQNLRILNIDRSAIKSEVPGINILIDNVVSMNTAISDDTANGITKGDRYYQAIQFSNAVLEVGTTPTIPNNIVVRNCTCGAISMVGKLHGVKIAENLIYMNEFVNDSAYLAGITMTFQVYSLIQNQIIPVDGTAGDLDYFSSDISIINNTIDTSKSTETFQQGIRLTTARGVENLRIVNNSIKSQADSIFVFGTQNGFKLLNRKWTISNNKLFGAVNMNGVKYDGLFILGNEADKITLRGTPSDVLDVQIFNNVFVEAFAIDSDDVVAANNIVKNDGNNRISDTAKTRPAKQHIQTTAGEWHTVVDVGTIDVDVKGLSHIRMSPASATIVNDFSNEYDTQDITVLCTNSNTTISNNASISYSDINPIPANGILKFTNVNNRWFLASKSF